MASIGHHFYSKRAGFAILALGAIMAMAASVAPAQSNKKNEKGPRALAVVELPADGKSKPRLIPITILVKGRFWDASIYLADPRPMALDPGNVYEVERSGKPVGFFTVGEARKTKDRWIAFGDWQPESEKAPPAAKPALSWHAEDDDRPVLHKRQPSAPGAAQAASPSSSAAPAPVPPPQLEDPNRPVLRRGKPKPQPQEPQEEPAVAATSPSKPVAPPPAEPSKAGEALPAISDAGGPEPRPYTYAWAADEQQKLTKAVSDMAMAEVARYVKSTPALRHTPGVAFDQTAIRAFDLDYDNNPEVVFTARVLAAAPQPMRTRAAKPSSPAPEFFFYVTVVGRTDLYGQMRKLFSSVTDSAHVDAFPRLELIDAVDAEGTGRGNLLFRAWSGDTASYRLYHVSPDSLRKLFDSAGE